MTKSASARPHATGAFALAIATLGAGSAMAQATTHSQATPPRNEVGEIVVTAQRRETALADTPLSVMVAAQPLLANVGVTDIKDLAILTPGLLVASTSNETYTTARIRGVGTVGDNPGLESSVGVIVDGVFRVRNGVALGDLGEVERIEVLRGPQNTLFGQNTSAGIINVVTTPPSFVFGAEAEATVGDYGAHGGSLSVTGPLTETLAGRLYVAARRRDGFYDVRTGDGPRTATDDQNQNYETLRGQLLFTPSDRLSIRGAVDYTTRDERCCVGVQLSVGPTQPILALMAPDGGVAASPAPWNRQAWSNRDTNTRIHDGGGSVQIDLETPLGKLTSTSAYREWRAVLSQDWDFTSADLAYRPDDGSWSNRFRTFSQELRLTGSRGRFDYTAGAYFADERLLRRDSLLYGADYEDYLGRILSRSTANPLGLAGYVSSLTGLPVGQNYVAGQGLIDTYRQKAQTTALFGQQTWRATDRLSLTLGLRYTRVAKDLDAAYSNTDNGRACAAALARGVNNATLCLPWSNPAFNDLRSSQSITDEGWSGLARAEYRLTPSVLTYASWSRGRKSAGFNLDRAQTALAPDARTDFPAETVDSYEIGAKAAFADRRVLVSAAAFHQTYDGFQLNTFLGTTFLVRSIPQVTAKGAEVEVITRPLTGLSLQGGFTYAQTEYGDTPFAGLPLLAGARLSFAPLWSGSLAGSYERPIGGFVGRLTLAAKYSSSYNTGSDLDPTKVQPGFWLMDGCLGLSTPGQDWSLEVWARNLLDTEYRQVAFGAPFQTGTTGAFLGAPRTIGVTLRRRIP